VPASFAPTEELIALARAAAEVDGMYISHIRSEGSGLFEFAPFTHIVPPVMVLYAVGGFDFRFFGRLNQNGLNAPEFGHDDRHLPMWTKDIANRGPVFRHPRKCSSNSCADGLVRSSDFSLPPKGEATNGACELFTQVSRATHFRARR